MNVGELKRILKDIPNHFEVAGPDLSEIMIFMYARRVDKNKVEFTGDEYGSNQGGALGRVGPKRGSLSQVVQERISPVGKNRERLNPKWVAQLMGLPADWL